MKKKIVVLTGAGISQESGISTFRDSNGLWENHKVEDVASPQGWRKNPKLVLDFYNQRRAQLHTVEPNDAHRALADLEAKYDVRIITQNVDDLHERAGSTKVLHLHGELRKVRSVADPAYIVKWENDVQIGDVCPKGGQLRPHIVWFGEDVPLLGDAMALATQADEFWIIGTSLQVYPAAGLMNYRVKGTPVYYIDPYPAENLGQVWKPNTYDFRTPTSEKMVIIADKATNGVRQLVEARLGR